MAYPGKRLIQGIQATICSLLSFYLIWGRGRHPRPREYDRTFSHSVVTRMYLFQSVRENRCLTWEWTSKVGGAYHLHIQLRCSCWTSHHNAIHKIKSLLESVCFVRYRGFCGGIFSRRPAGLNGNNQDRESTLSELLSNFIIMVVISCVYAFCLESILQECSMNVIDGEYQRRYRVGCCMGCQCTRDEAVRIMVPAYSVHACTILGISIPSLINLLKGREGYSALGALPDGIGTRWLVLSGLLIVVNLRSHCLVGCSALYHQRQNERFSPATLEYIEGCQLAMSV